MINEWWSAVTHTDLFVVFGLRQDSSLSQSLTLPRLNTLHASLPLKIKDEDIDDRGTKHLDTVQLYSIAKLLLFITFNTVP